MTLETFKAFLVTQNHQQYETSIANLAIADLPKAEVLIRVHYSSLNYKDALSATGHPGVTKKFPHIPGVDAAGVVVSSTALQFHPGDAVIVTGFDQGMNTWGGFAEYIRVPAAWVILLPEGMTLRESMILGTAGLTAGLGIQALQQNGVTPQAGEVLVTGSTGSVGSLAIAILAKLGYTIAAVTGKTAQHDYLKALGATTILAREEVEDRDRKPLLKERWSGVVDTVGGNILATAIKSTKYGGCVTACGLVGGADLSTTVYPFILRGMRLIGIDSAACSISVRTTIWQQLAADWKPANLEGMATEIQLSQLPEKIAAILRGENVGRVLVKPT
jgi:acrylyl-CoA reductase (NADPH)